MFITRSVSLIFLPSLSMKKHTSHLYDMHSILISNKKKSTIQKKRLSIDQTLIRNVIYVSLRDCHVFVIIIEVLCLNTKNKHTCVNYLFMDLFGSRLRFSANNSLIYVTLKDVFLRYSFKNCTSVTF